VPHLLEFHLPFLNRLQRLSQLDWKSLWASSWKHPNRNHICIFWLLRYEICVAVGSDLFTNSFFSWMRSDRDQLGMPNQFLGFALFTPRVTQIYRTRTVKMGLVIHIKRVSFFFLFLFKAVLPLENFLPFFFKHAILDFKTVCRISLAISRANDILSPIIHPLLQ
jgi:hypothetical protein